MSAEAAKNARPAKPEGEPSKTTKKAPKAERQARRTGARRSSRWSQAKTSRPRFSRRTRATSPMTGGDDPRASTSLRDFARRAAKAGPTLARHLLAGRALRGSQRETRMARQGADRRRRALSPCRASAGAGRACAHRHELARRDALLRSSAGLRFRQRPRGPRARRALPRGRAQADGTSDARIGPRQESAIGGLVAGLRRSFARRGASHRSRRGGQPLRRAALRRHQLS